METFQRGVLTFQHREDRDLQGFRDFQSSSSPRLLGGDLLRFSGASFLAELVLSHILQEANPALFAHLVSLLDRLESAPGTRVAGVVVSGAWTLLLDFGFPPSLDACVRCGRPLPSEGLARFDVEGGGLRCDACSRDGPGPRLGPEARAALREMVGGRPPASLRGGAAHLSLVERYALHHLDRRRPFQSTTLLRTALGSTEEGESG